MCVQIKQTSSIFYTFGKLFIFVVRILNSVQIFMCACAYVYVCFISVISKCFSRHSCLDSEINVKDGKSW